MKTGVGKIAATERCHRCGGFMVSEVARETGTTEWHCVMCGDRIDPVILAHRRQNSARRDAEKLFVGLGMAHLN